MDEVGRGTGTVDGLSIAQAVCEYVVHRIGCRTMFATHYHELTEMKLAGMKNCRMAVNEQGDSVVFLKRVEDGAALQSYGIHVAGLAGIPEAVMHRASELLQEHRSADRHVPVQTRQSPATSAEELSLFRNEEIVADTIRSVSVDTTSPVDALLLLQKLKKMLQSD